jgi:hypothetical protein
MVIRVPTQDGAHRRGGHLDAQLAAVADDSQISPAGFSRANRTTRSTTAGSSPLCRPGAGYVQRRRTSSRCQRSSVDGVTRKIFHRSR